MNRLTKQDIKILVESDKAVGMGAAGRGDPSRGETLAKHTQEFGVRSPAPKKKAVEFLATRIAAAKGRLSQTDTTFSDFASAAAHVKGAKGSHVTQMDTKRIVHRESKESYFNQLREACAAWWCGTTQENMIDTFDNTDKSYAAYSKAVAGEQDRFFTDRTKRSKGRRPGATGASSSAIPLVKKLKEGAVASARRKGAANLRTIGEIIGQIPDPRAKLLKSGADFQAGIIDSPKNEDTMTGDIGSVEMGMGAVPLRGMGPADEEDRKRRGKKRRKMATLMGIATGAVQGIGN